MQSPQAGGSALSPLPLAGGRRRSSKKLRLVKKKTARKILAKHGVKIRGGGPVDGVVDPVSGEDKKEGGRRRRSHRKSHRRSRRGFFF